MTTLVTPKNHLHNKEQQTIELIKTLNEKGYKEGLYEKPFRVFTKGFDVVKINIMGAVVDHNGDKIFKGNEYGNSVQYFKSLNIN